MKTVGDFGLPENERTNWLVQQQEYLRVLARAEIDHRLGGKFDPSDLVQQTIFEAWQGWDRLQATDTAQRLAWLRKILSNQLAKQIRRYRGTDMRDLKREVSIEQSLNHSACRLEDFIAGNVTTPSHLASIAEQRTKLLAALDALPEDYQRVIRLRNFEELSHNEVASRMNRSEAAVRMLWIRALQALAAALTSG